MSLFEMATKVNHASAIEPRRVQSAAMTTSAASTSSPKGSMFGAKSGFVIPKNKLSGSLVPVFRDGRKPEVSDAAKEESSIQVQRKTKWGTNLTQDAAVRKGRGTLAYQTRVEQITQQLKSGILITGDAKASQSATQVPKSESSSHQINNENLQAQKLELLELERRNAIGEILKLNPVYKAPSSYKPLLKEAVVPIPLKAYPKYNFIDLLLGPGSNTQKRLEEETGAKIRVHGTKAGTGEKAEITEADGNEVWGAYEELYVHVSADTYQKIDAAIALIELLVSPVPGNSAVVSTTPTSVSGDSVNAPDQSQGDLVTGYMMPVAVGKQGVMQPMSGPAQPGPLQVQFQPYPSSWFPLSPPHTLIRPTSGNSLRPNTSLPIHNNLVQFPPSPLNPLNISPVLGGLPPAVPRNPSLVATTPQPSMPVLQRPYTPEAWPLSHVSPRIYALPGPQLQPAHRTTLAQLNSTALLPFTGNQHTLAGPAPVARQPVLTAPSGHLLNRPLTPTRSSTGRSAVPAVTPAAQWMGNMMQMAPPTVAPQRPCPVVQPVVASAAAQTISATVLSRPANIFSPARFPSWSSTPQLAHTLVDHHAAAPGFASVQLQEVSSTASSSPLPSTLLPVSLASAPASIQSTLSVAPVQPVNIQALVPNPSQNSVLGSSPVPPPVPSTSRQPQSVMPTVPGSFQSLTPIKSPVTSPGSFPPVAAPKSQSPSSDDFTFQPFGPQQLQAFQTFPRSSGRPLAQNTPKMPPKPAVQLPLAPQLPSFRPAVHSGMQSFPRSRLTNHMGQPHASVRPPSPGSVVPFAGNRTLIPPSPGSVVPFAGNPTPIPPPPRLPANQHPVPPTIPNLHSGPQSFGSALHMPNMPSLLPPVAANPLQLQQNQLTQTIQPETLLFPNQHLNNTLSFASSKPASSHGGNQIYDPVLRTSVSLPHLTRR